MAHPAQDPPVTAAERPENLPARSWKRILADSPVVVALAVAPYGASKGAGSTVRFGTFSLLLALLGRRRRRTCLR